MSFLARREVRTLIVALTSVLVIADLFVKMQSLNDLVVVIMTWGIVIAAFTILLGAVNVGIYHLQYITKRSPGRWYLSIWTLFLMALVFALGLFGQYSPSLNSAYSVIVEQIFGPMTASAYGLIGFYFASSLFKSFRVRNTYVALFMVAGVLVILMNAPVSEIVLPGITGIGNWVVNVPSGAGYRGILLGASIGFIAAGLRSMLGYERASVGGA